MRRLILLLYPSCFCSQAQKKLGFAGVSAFLPTATHPIEIFRPHYRNSDGLFVLTIPGYIGKIGETTGALDINDPLFTVSVFQDMSIIKFFSKLLI